jgi:GDP-L-fucose synthase
MKKILVTGASSFLGHHVMPLLENYNTSFEPEWLTGDRGTRLIPRFEIFAPSSKELNLLNRDSVIAYIKKHKPDTILHMAALCGGIGANKKRPGDFILHNTKMATNLFDAISEVNFWDNPSMTRQVVTHFYGLGSVCGYPKNCPVPFKEEDLWNGFPEETNAPYGTAKRHMIVMQDAYRLQHGLRGAHLIPVNLYGEYDHFNLDNSHVMPALINKFIAAKQNEDESVEVWGDGTPTREFLYAGDCAEAIVRAVVTGFDYPIPVNIGTGHDISIKDLADLIKEVVGFDGEIRFTGEVSVNGQPKRRLDVSRARDVLGFTAKTDLRTGLEKTVAWYQKSKSKPVGQMENKTEYEALSKLNRIINLLEKNTEEVFDQISRNPKDTRMEAIINKYLGLLTLSLERAQALRNSKTAEVGGVYGGGAIFVKAKPAGEIEPVAVDLQSLVAMIRNAIGEPELLKRIAAHIDSIKPNFNTITQENKEFLLGLIARAQQAHKPNTQKPGIDLHTQIPLSFIKPETLKRDSDAYRTYTEKFKFNEYKGSINPVEFLVRAGLDRGVAENRVKNGLGNQKNRAEVLKAIGINDNPIASKITSTNPVQQQELRKLAAQINAIKDDSEKPKYNRVIRKDPYGEVIEFEKKPDVQESLKVISESTEKAQNIFNKKTQNLPNNLFGDDIKKFNGSLGITSAEDKLERDLSFYEHAEVYKREKAKNAIFGVGHGSFRRGGMPEDEDHRNVKYLSEHESDFMKAAEKFAKEHGIPVSDLVRYKRGKRLPDGNLLNNIGVTDTEIMMSTIKLPRSNRTKVEKTNVNRSCKVESKKKYTLIGSVKKFVSSVIESIKW